WDANVERCRRGANGYLGSRGQYIRLVARQSDRDVLNGIFGQTERNRSLPPCRSRIRGDGDGVQSFHNARERFHLLRWARGRGPRYIYEIEELCHVQL